MRINTPLGGCWTAWNLKQGERTLERLWKLGGMEIREEEMPGAHQKYELLSSSCKYPRESTEKGEMHSSISRTERSHHVPLQYPRRSSEKERCTSSSSIKNRKTPANL
jgi:hypothetical protein